LGKSLQNSQLETQRRAIPEAAQYVKVYAGFSTREACSQLPGNPYDLFGGTNPVGSVSTIGIAPSANVRDSQINRAATRIKLVLAKKL